MVGLVKQIWVCYSLAISVGVYRMTATPSLYGGITKSLGITWKFRVF